MFDSSMLRGGGKEYFFLSSSLTNYQNRDVSGLQVPIIKTHFKFKMIQAKIEAENMRDIQKEKVNMEDFIPPSKD